MSSPHSPADNNGDHTPMRSRTVSGHSDESNQGNSNSNAGKRRNSHCLLRFATDEEEPGSPLPSGMNLGSGVPTSPNTPGSNKDSLVSLGEDQEVVQAVASPRSMLSAAIADEVEAEVESKRQSLFAPSGGGGNSRRSVLNLTSPKNRKPSTQQKTMSVSRVASLLNGFPFFADFEDGVVMKLANVVEQCRYPEGTVLFRQADPPGNCYVIVSGQIGVFVKNSDAPGSGDEGDPRSGSKKRQSEKRGSIDDDVTPTNFRRFRRSSSNPALDEKQLEELASRRLTVEGFSLYHANSDLGVSVATVKAGSLIGEIALLQDEPRTASLKCMQETACIIIGREEFESVLKAEMQRVREEKVNFMLEHLPGLRDVPVLRGRPHPTYYFKKVNVSKGHEFFKQGQVAEDAVHLVVNGNVEFRRREDNSHVSKSSPLLSKKVSSLMAGSPSAALRATKARLGAATGMMGPGSEDMSKPKLTRRIGTLQAGGVFGSLPLTETEPFTVVASSALEVYSISTDIARLPRKLLTSIQEYLTEATTWRLGRVQSCRAADALQQQQFVYKSRPKPWLTEDDLGLSLLLTGKLHPPPSFRKDSPHPGLPTTGTVMAQNGRTRPQSAPTIGRLPNSPMGERGLQVEAGKDGNGNAKLRPASAPGHNMSSSKGKGMGARSNVSNGASPAQRSRPGTATGGQTRSRPSSAAAVR